MLWRICCCFNVSLLFGRFLTLRRFVDACAALLTFLADCGKEIFGPTKPRHQGGVLKISEYWAFCWFCCFWIPCWDPDFGVKDVVEDTDFPCDWCQDFVVEIEFFLCFWCNLWTGLKPINRFETHGQVAAVKRKNGGLLARYWGSWFEEHRGLKKQSKGTWNGVRSTEAR